jgi:hypothetical protein
VNSLAQGKPNLECGHPQGAGNTVVGVLKLVAGGEAVGTKLGVAFQGTDHGCHAFGGGTEVEHLIGKRGVGRELVGTEARGNVAHISRRACARVITRTRTRGRPAAAGGSLELAFGHFGEEPRAAVPVRAEPAKAVAPLANDARAGIESFAQRGVSDLVSIRAVSESLRRKLAALFAKPCRFGEHGAGVDGNDEVEVIGV